MSLARLALIGALALSAAVQPFVAPQGAMAQEEKRPASTASATATLDGVVNVNQASAEQLRLLPGVGPAKAQAILEYRKTNGAFKRVEDLLSVSGIGDRALERLRPFVVLEGKTTATERSR